MKLKKPLSLILAICMLLGFASLLPQGAFDVQTVSAAEESVSIDKTYLIAGQELPVSNPSNYTLEFFIDAESAAHDSLTLTQQHYEKWITVKAYNKDGKVMGEDKVYFSKLPVIYINTDDGGAVTSKDEYKDADMFVQNNTKSKSAMYSGKISIKGRGNTTWNLPKKPYKIKLDKKTDLFGMGKNKHWVLLANYIDESLMRNQTAFEMSKQLGVDAMDSVWTDVVFNGEYVGNYQLCEHIRIDDTRVDIFDWEDEAENVASAVSKAEKALKDKKSDLETALKEDLSWVTTGKFTFEGKTYSVADYCDHQSDISGGYLFELSNEYDEISKFTTPGGLKVMLKSPEYLNTNPDMMFYASRYWTSLEAAYKAEDGYVKMAQGNTHYTELADLDSMVAYWLVMEVMGNNDAVWKSRFAYKDIGEPLKFGPAWDFDYYSGSILTDPVYDTNWVLSLKGVQDNFFKEFLDDPLFICKATEKYWELRPYLEDLVKDGGIIDTQTAYLNESGLADQARWDRALSYKDKARGFAADANAFKAFLKKRIAWLDEQFETDSALLLSTYNEFSAYPYEKADGKLDVTLTNAEADKLSKHAAADGVIGVKSDLSVRVSVTDSTTKSAKVYVNGILYGSYDLKNSKADITITNDKLTQPDGKKNVISVIGKDAKGQTTYKNFASVIKNKYDCKGVHSYGKASYEWSEDNSSCTATIVCAKCGEKQSETVKTKYSVTKTASCTAMGKGTYTAAFTNALFTKQTNAEDIARSAHKWGEWKITKKATDTQDGVKTRTCQSCSQTQAQRIAATKQTLYRFGGANRYETAASVSYDSSEFEDSEYVLLASGKSYADALSAVPLAKAYNAPILLTDKDLLPSATLNQLKSMKNVRTVIIIGGTGVVSDSVQQQLYSSGYLTQRIAGADRFETAAKIARQLKQVTGKAPSEVFFVYYNDFPDALSASAAAAVKGAPILYVRTTGDLDSATQKVLAELKGSVKTAYAVGGEAVISESVRKFKIQNHLGVQAVRVSGANRYQTCLAVNNKFNSAFTGSSVFVATGRQFPDALTGSVLAALKGSPLLLVDEPITSSQEQYIKDRKIGSVYLLGGTSAVPDSTAKKITQAAKL